MKPKWFRAISFQANETGKYYVDCKEAKVAPTAEDDQVAEKLWCQCYKTYFYFVTDAEAKYANVF